MSDAGTGGYQAEVSAAWREVVESAQLTCGYRLLMWIGRSLASWRLLLYATLVVLSSVVVGVAMLLPQSQTTAHTMSGLNAGIVRATEVDRDGQPTRIALGVEGAARALDQEISSLPLLGGGLLPSFSAQDVTVLAVHAWYVLLSITAAVSEGAANALHGATTLPKVQDFRFEESGDTWQGGSASDGGGLQAFLQNCVYRRTPCVVRGGIFPSGSGEAGSDGDYSKPEDWGGADVLHEALGPETLVYPLVPLRCAGKSDVEKEHVGKPPAHSCSDVFERSVDTFSQHQNENVEMSVTEFGRRLLAGQSLQLRLTLAEWEERNATSGPWAPPSPLTRGDCCMSHQGLFFEPAPLDTSPAAKGEARPAQEGAENAVWKRSRPSGLWFSTLGTRTPLHNDPSDSFLAQLAGAKSLIVLPGPPSPELSPLLLRLIGRHGASGGAGLRETYSGIAAAMLKYAGAMTADLHPGDMLYLPALWLHDIETVAVARPLSAEGDKQSAEDRGSAQQWPVSVSYACRFEPRCLRNPPRQKRRRESKGDSRHRHQPEEP